MQRRKFVKATSIAALGGLTAGCMGNGGDGGDGGAEPTDTPEPDDTPELTDTPEPTDTPEATDTPEPTDTAEPTDTTEPGTEETTAGAGEIEGTVGETPEGIEVTSTSFESQGDGNATITGVIENTGDQTYEELEVQATLFDDNDEVLGQFFHNTEEAEAGDLTPFEPGDQWEFTVEFESADLSSVIRYRVDVDAEIDDSVFDVGERTETTTAG